MSSAPEGWYVDPSTGTNLRLWNGSSWTGEVAPLPFDPSYPGKSGPFTLSAGQPEPGSAPKVKSVPKHAAEPGADEGALPAGVSVLDPEVEETQLTRRQLRARNGATADIDDAPKHLSPLIPAAVVPVEHQLEPVEDVEIPGVTVELPGEPTSDPVHRHQRIVRLSMLLGVLAVVSSVAALTAGTL